VWEGENKRKCIAAEDDKFIKLLHDVSLDTKWRSDGNFKNGYMLELEAHLSEKLSNAKKKSVIPHVDSRIRYFKIRVCCPGTNVEQEWLYMG
jgi:hypothetical protein